MRNEELINFIKEVISCDEEAPSFEVASIMLAELRIKAERILEDFDNEE